MNTNHHTTSHVSRVRREPIRPRGRRRLSRGAITIFVAASSGAMILGAGVAPAVAANITGTQRADNITGTRHADHIEARAGHDTVLARAGGDEVLAGLGADHVELGYGDDLGQGGPGADHVFGGPGSDTVLGSRSGANQPGDLLYGGPGSDAVQGFEAHGGGGNDWLEGHRLFGNDGADEFYIAGGGHLVVAGTGADEVYTAYERNETVGDVIRCGPGEDTVHYVDTQDATDELHDCEHVEVHPAED